MVTIERRHLPVQEIYSYLSKNDKLFKPPLSTRLELESYAIKLNKYAVHFCATEKEMLVGFLGCYFNDQYKEFGFISTLSVADEFKQKGIAKQLLTMALKFGVEKGFRKIKLQVHTSNLSAIRFYSENGFLEGSGNSNMSDMTLDL